MGSTLCPANPDIVAQLPPNINTKVVDHVS